MSLVTLQEIFGWDITMIDQYLSEQKNKIDVSTQDEVVSTIIIEKYIKVCHLLAEKELLSEEDISITHREDFHFAFYSTKTCPKEERFFHGLVNLGLINPRCYRNVIENNRVIDPISHDPIDELYILNDICYDINTLSSFFRSGWKTDPLNRELIPEHIIEEVISLTSEEMIIDVGVNNKGLVNLSLTNSLFSQRGSITHVTLQLYNFNTNNIIHLNLQGNSIESIYGIIFPPLCNILNLQDNHLENLDNITFPNSIVELDISYNRIISCANTFFPESLKHLCLRHNYITSIDEFEIPCTLEILDLGRNQIESIDNFVWPFNLKEFYIDHNNLLRLHKITFPSLIEILNFSANQISEVTNIIIVSSIISFWLINNPILKGDNPFIDWLRKDGTKVIQEDLDTFIC